MSIKLNNTDNDIELGYGSEGPSGQEEGPSGQEECLICFETMVSNVTLCCGHKHCLDCHTNFIKSGIKTCAFCRQEIKSLTNCIEHIDEIKTSSSDLDIRTVDELMALEKCKLCLRCLCIIILLMVFALIMVFSDNNDCPEADGG